jgi:hypothetical protein
MSHRRPASMLRPPSCDRPYHEGRCGHRPSAPFRTAPWRVAAAHTMARSGWPKAAAFGKIHRPPSYRRGEARLTVADATMPDLRSASRCGRCAMPDNCKDSVGPHASFQPVRRLLPVYPDEQTFSESVGMSQTYTQQTSTHGLSNERGAC